MKIQIWGKNEIFQNGATIGRICSYIHCSLIIYVYFIFFMLFLPLIFKNGNSPQTYSGFYISAKNISCSYSIFQGFFNVFFKLETPGFCSSACLLSKPDNIGAQGLFPKLLCLLLQQCVVNECRHAGLKQWLWMHLSQLHHKTNDKHIFSAMCVALYEKWCRCMPPFNLPSLFASILSQSYG